MIPYRAGGLSSLKVFGNFGRGVKSPTFLERFGGSFADPNPDLVVEQAKSGDVGVEATLADSRVRVTAAYFRNDFTDQISYRPGAVGDGIPEYINIDGSRASGVELEAGLQRPIGGFLAWVTYSFVDSEVVTNQNTSQQFQPGQPLLRRPKHSGSVRAAYTFGRATANVNFRIIGDRFDNSFLSLRTVPNAGSADRDHDRRHRESRLRRGRCEHRTSPSRSAHDVRSRRQYRRHRIRLGSRLPRLAAIVRRRRPDSVRQAVEAWAASRAGKPSASPRCPFRT